MPSRSGAIAGEGHEHQKPGWSAVHKVFVMMCLPLRRMGENLIATRPEGRPLMVYRENTIRSFNAAAAAGASFVEFDVQVHHCDAWLLTQHTLNSLWSQKVVPPEAERLHEPAGPGPKMQGS